MSFFDEDAVTAGYESVRAEDNDVNWVVFKYEDKVLDNGAQGAEYQELLDLLGDDDRAYAYVRFETGDEMSRRAKFAFITWIGPSVSPLKKAKVSTDKAFIKKIWTQFGKEILADEKGELKYEKVKNELEKASGANYGTGK